MPKTEIVIPASTSNLGASFDACGLALSLYLNITIEETTDRFEIVPFGEGAERVPRDESNLIARVARFVAVRRQTQISGARLIVDSQIPLARGLGSSSSAIIAGLSIFEALSGQALTPEEMLRYALHFEGHGDNLAPSLLGGLVVACVVEGPDGPSLVTVKRDWPAEVKVVLAIPDYELDTQKMRSALASEVSLSDAVFNLQRSALLQAAISERRFDLFNEALRDRLHQSRRVPFGRGLTEVLQLNDETDRFDGLLGVAVSGAGSTMAAFATNNFDRIANEMSERLAAAGVESRVLHVEADTRGRRVIAG